MVGAFGATGAIVAAMVGSGIFSLTGQFGAAIATPTNVIAAWIIGGVLALCGGLCLAELGAMIPCSGGSVEFARRAFGATTGYLVATVTIVAGYFLSITVVALLLAQYVDALVASDLPDVAVAAAAIVVAAGSQFLGLRAGWAVGTGLAILKFGVVAAFVGLGLAWPVETRLSAPAPAEAPGLLSAPVAAAALTVSFAYLGWSTGADVAGDVRRPGRNVPLAIVASVLIVIALYLGVNLVYLRVIDPGAMTDGAGGPMPAIGSVAARLLFGEAAGAVLTATIALLFLSTMVSGTITAARVLESMARAGEIAPSLGRRRPDGVPARALLVTLVASLVPLAVGSLDAILDTLTVLVNLASSLSVAAVIVLRRTMPDAPRPFRVPLYPFVPIVYLAIAGWSIVAKIESDGASALLESLAIAAGLLLLRPLLHPHRLHRTGVGTPSKPDPDERN